MTCAEKWLSRKIVCRTRIILVCAGYAETELFPQLTPWGPREKLWKCQQRFFPYILASVCRAVQSHLSLGSQGAEFVCRCWSHATAINFFHLVSLTLIGLVSHLSDLHRGQGTFFKPWVFTIIFHGLAGAKYTQKANCIIIKIVSYTQPEDVKSVSWLCLLI